jgi:hypothetical protein
VCSMRWTSLFADLEHQLEAAAVAERWAQIADLTRAERAGVAWGDRLRARLGHPVRVGLEDGQLLAGQLADAGSGWLLLTDRTQEHLVPLRAVATVRGVGPASAPPDGVTLRRLGLGHALRAVSRNRDLVRVVTSAGDVVGRLEAVGSDHVDVGLVDEGSRRPTGEAQLTTFSGLRVVGRV